MKRKTSDEIKTAVDAKTCPIRIGWANIREELPATELIGTDILIPMLSGSPLRLLL